MSFAASCRTASPMTLPRLQSIAALRRAWKAVIGLANALDYTKPLPNNLNGIFDVVFDCNGNLTPEEEGRLKKKGDKIYDIAPSAAKFFRTLLSRSRKIIFADLKAENLQHVVDLAVAGKLTIPIAKICSLADAPDVLASLERGQRLNGKAVITL